MTNFGGSGRGAIAGCHCTGEGDDQLWGSGRGAIAGCHCSVLWLGGHFSSTLITPKLVFAIWGLCWYNFYGKTTWFVGGQTPLFFMVVLGAKMVYIYISNPSISQHRNPISFWKRPSNAWHDREHQVGPLGTVQSFRSWPLLGPKRGKLGNPNQKKGVTLGHGRLSEI